MGNLLFFLRETGGVYGRGTERGQLGEEEGGELHSGYKNQSNNNNKNNKKKMSPLWFEDQGPWTL